MSLVENIKFQMASVATLFFVMIVWIFLFVNHGLDQAVPTVGPTQGSLVGFVLNNFAFVSTFHEILLLFFFRGGVWFVEA